MKSERLASARVHSTLGSRVVSVQDSAEKRGFLCESGLLTGSGAAMSVSLGPERQLKSSPSLHPQNPDTEISDPEAGVEAAGKSLTYLLL